MPTTFDQTTRHNSISRIPITLEPTLEKKSPKLRRVSPYYTYYFKYLHYYSCGARNSPRAIFIGESALSALTRFSRAPTQVYTTMLYGGAMPIELPPPIAGNVVSEAAQRALSTSIARCSSSVYDGSTARPKIIIACTEKVLPAGLAKWHGMARWLMDFLAWGCADVLLGCEVDLSRED